VRSSRTPDFDEMLSRLPPHIERAAVKAYRLWKDNPQHPSLQFKRVGDPEPLYSARVTQDYRAVAWIEEDHATWYFIGTHTEYDRLLR
jgi:hypothetical protein